MTTKLTAALAAAALATGILLGAAGTVLIRDVTHAPMGMADMVAMHGMMVGTGDMKMDAMMEPGAPIDPPRHELHHPGPNR